MLRANVVIDEKFMKETLRVTGLKNMREAVELGLRTIVRLRKQEKIRRFRGKLPWQGDLDAMRSDSDTGRYQRLDRLLSRRRRWW
jgi:Arc/MetJ family transcription regulator